MALDGDVLGDSFKKYPDLHDNLKYLQAIGFSKRELGLLYLNFLVEHCQRNPGKPFIRLNAEKERRAKRSFQESTREYFSGIKINLKYDKLTKEEIMGATEEQSLVERSSEAIKNYEPFTIQTAVHTILENSVFGLERVGGALMLGSLAYMLEEKHNADSAINPSLFKEYNRIYTHLKNIKSIK